MSAVIMDDHSWTDADKAAEAEKIKAGRTLLEGWANWSKTHGIYTDFPPASAIDRVMIPAQAEEQAGARHMVIVSDDAEAMLTEQIVTHWRMTRRRYWKLVRIEFLTGGSSEQKARRVGLTSRVDYRTRIERIELMLAEEFERRSSLL